FEFQPTPISKRIGLSGGFVNGFSFTGSLPHNRAFVSAFYDGPAGTWLAGLDFGATVHYTGQYQDDNIDLIAFGLKPRKVRQRTILVRPAKEEILSRRIRFGSSFWRRIVRKRLR